MYDCVKVKITKNYSSSGFNIDGPAVPGDTDCWNGGDSTHPHPLLTCVWDVTPLLRNWRDKDTLQGG